MKYKIIIPSEESKQGRTCTNNCSVVCGECQIFDKKPITNLEKLQFPELVEELTKYYKKVPLVEKPVNLSQETLEEAAEKYANKKGDIPTTKLEDAIFKQGFIDGAKWQQEQEQNNENSWFNEYQKLEDYIIKRIADKFLEATPEKYNTASEATIALLEDNWEQDENIYTEKQERMYSEDDMIMFADFFHNYKELLKKEKWEILEMSKEDIFKKWIEKVKKK